jgi:hypothetical protein
MRFPQATLDIGVAGSIKVKQNSILTYGAKPVERVLALDELGRKCWEVCGVD